MNKILKLTFILFLVCAITAGVLGGVNELTRGRIAAINEAKTNEAYLVVLDAEGFEKIEFDPANACFAHVDKFLKGTGGEGYVVESTFSGAQGNITMATGVSPDLTCTGISIIEHSETAGLGANAASTAEVGVNFRAQFVGVGSDVALTKSGGTIDGLTGATITSNAIAAAVAESIKAVDEIINNPAATIAGDLG